jgi:hypothetical protein
MVIRIFLLIFFILIYHDGTTQYNEPESNQNNVYYIKVLERKIKFMTDSINKLQRTVNQKENIIDPLSEETESLKDTIDKYQNDVNVSKRVLLRYIKSLEIQNELLEDSLYVTTKDLSTAKRIMLTENVEKKAWIKVSVGAIVLIAGTALAVSTGLWIPVFMGVAAIELFLLVEGSYRLNIHELKELEKKEKRIKI